MTCHLVCNKSNTTDVTYGAGFSWVFLGFVRQTKLKNAKKKKHFGHSVGKLRVIYEQFEDTKGGIRIRKSNKGRRCNGNSPQTLRFSQTFSQG
jgi:hypothetical protein